MDEQAKQPVAVIGLGTMGAGIAEVYARGGHRVIGIDRDETAVSRGRTIIARSTDRAVERGKLSSDDRDALVDRIEWHTDLAAAADAALVVEAAFEDITVKRDIFTRLADVVGPETVLATNTSSLSVTELAAATTDPSRVVGVHFFNPAPVQQLVEIISTVHTDPAVRDRLAETLHQLGKTTIGCGDRAGFVVNRLLIGYLNRAITLYGNGYARRDEIDHAMVEGAGYPMGPFALCDLVGLEVTLAVVERIWDETRDRADAPAPLLRQLVAAGRHGRKSGRGFHPHDGSDAAEPGPEPLRNRRDEFPDLLVLPYLNEALRMVEQGYASSADIDTGMSLGCRMPKPFDQLAELGPAAVLAGQRAIHAETGEASHLPCRLLVELGEAAEPTAALAELRS
ncbi:3-hydroxyacyl-CoA dehydrogenase NAD-binding domain-containing protein [Propionibacteriaceae bacterium Y2011]